MKKIEWFNNNEKLKSFRNMIIGLTFLSVSLSLLQNLGKK